MGLAGALNRRELIVVTGKGGVGKSVLTGVLGRHLAAQGRRTLLLEVDRRENLHQVLGVPPSAGEIVSVPDARGLYLQNLKPAQVADWVVQKKVKIRPLVDRILKSGVYQRFVEGAPGLTELAILGHTLRLVRGDLSRAPKVDTVVLDAPATGHGVYLLDAPRLVAEAIGEGPFAELAGEVVEFVAAPGHCSVVVVTLAEEMPVQEALEFRGRLKERLGMEPELLVVNGLYPALPDGIEAGDDGLTSLWLRRRHINEEGLTRLHEHWPGPLVELPLLPLDNGTRLARELELRFTNVLEQVGL
jgi:anion-transporting  ArsA/GET3 family ATPase